MAGIPSSPPSSEPVRPASSQPAGSLIESADAPADCLPEALRAVLSDLAGKFAGVRVVSTKELRSDNHSPGSARALMHEACRAVDVRTAAPAAEIVAYLRTRREIAGVQSYRNGIIHLDVSGGGAPAASAPPPTLAKRRVAPQEGSRTRASRGTEAPRAGTPRALAGRRPAARTGEPATTGSPVAPSRASDIRLAQPPEPARPPAPDPFAPVPTPGPER
jgi:hypothetical protein